MPGYEILGFTGAWESTDALHCRTHEIADKNMLQILHFPLFGHQEYLSSYTLNTEIKALSNKGLYADSLKLIYRINEAKWNTSLLSFEEEANFSASISGFSEGDKIEYYIHAADSSGRSENKPYMGALDPHVFYAGGISPVLTFSHEEIVFNEEGMIELTIQNSFDEPIEILNIDNELIYSVAEPNEKISFPHNMLTESLTYNISPLVAIKSYRKYNVDTLKIETIDSTYQVLIKCNESFTQNIDNSLLIDMVAYPNPLNEEICIKITNSNGAKFRSAKVYSISGQLIDILEPIILNDNRFKFVWRTNDVVKIEQGLYFVKIEFETGVKTIKVIKQ